MTSLRIPGGMGIFLCTHGMCSITGILAGEKYSSLNHPFSTSSQANPNSFNLRTWCSSLSSSLSRFYLFTLSFYLLIPFSPSLTSPPFYPCCRYLPLCHPLRPFRQSCLANSFPSAFHPFATSSTALGSYAYPIRSHIVLALMSSSPPPCHVVLLFAIISRTFYPSLAY